MALPVYDPGGTRQTNPFRAPQVNADDFGGMQARALTQAGGVIQQAGGKMMAIEDEQRQRDAAAKIMTASDQAANEMRERLYGKGGILEKTGVNAEGSTEVIQGEMRKLREQQASTFQSPEEQQAFNNYWSKFEQSMLDNVTKHEFQQRAAVRTTAKTAVLAGIERDVVASYNNPEALAKQFEIARTTIRANPDGLPVEAVSGLEAESVSSLHLQVIQRMAQDDPGKALEYYEANKGQVQGTGHAEAQKFIGAVSNIREVRATVDEVIGSGPAADIVRSVMGAETGGEADPAGAVSPAGAAGLMQVMPGTARMVAKQLGLQHVAEMDDTALQAYWSTPEGQRNNVRIGTAYLGQQIKKFGGDLEAALIAYNAGPENAMKFLNAGRDYNALPKPQETLPYVKKVMAGYRGIEISGETSEDIQKSLAGGGKRYYDGDSKAFLKERLQSQHGPEAVDGLSVDMSDRLAAMMNDAPPFVKDGLDVMSAYRSVDRQEQLWQQALKKYGSPEAARKWVAPPGNSQHNHGNASDLGWKGGKFAQAPKEVREWVHSNAEKYGLTFPMSYEPWHIETAEARGGKGNRVQRGQVAPNTAEYAQGRVESAFSGIEDDTNGFVAMTPQAASASDLYTKSIAPFTVGTQPSLEGALSQAREIYADNPTKLAEAERQITDQIKAQQTAAKETVEAAKAGVLRSIIGGGKVMDTDPRILEQIGSEGVSQLMTLEGKFSKGGDDTTDDATYIRLTQMDPDEFKTVPLIEFADRLSSGDLKKFADRQAELQRPNVSAAVLATDRTRSQIVTEAQNILGLSPNDTPDDALRLSKLNKALDLQIAAHIETTGKQPSGIEMQKMVDDLLVEGKISGSSMIMSDDKAMVFELTPEQKSSFYTAETVEDITPENRPAVAKVYRRIWGTTAAPGEEEAVQVYNDMVRVNLGGAPSPPAALDAKIRQGLASAYGRPPTVEEVSNFYREWIKRAGTGN